MKPEIFYPNASPVLFQQTLSKLLVKTAPQCRSWQQGEEVRAFVLNFPLSVLKSVQLISDQI
ncbi:unknown protein [Microcystis aeruginosa NIES-843]|uniref:Uncharacterized protein n=1 Tax=Microcystis aeruginosa (strain NIES-843 / IAM M-2473) TaxID=449447 RepID=B0JQS1_MICAN|nr:unknown protein [Microcystis aeruginosa NIES-843]